MQSGIVYERVGDEPSREQESTPLPYPATHTLNVHHPNDRRSMPQQDDLATSKLSGTVLDGEEPHTGPEMSVVRSMSIDSLQLTFSGANSLASPIQYDERLGEAGQPIPTRYSNECTLASDSQASTEFDGPRLVSRAPIQRDFAWCLAWFFDVVLTGIPILFLGMTVAFLPILQCHSCSTNGYYLISYCSSRTPVRPPTSVRLGRKGPRGEPPGTHTISHRLCCDL